jgi:hypothetical protein
MENGLGQYDHFLVCSFNFDCGGDKKRRAAIRRLDIKATFALDNMLARGKHDTAEAVGCNTPGALAIDAKIARYSTAEQYGCPRLRRNRRKT